MNITLSSGSSTRKVLTGKSDKVEERISGGRFGFKFAFKENSPQSVVYKTGMEKELVYRPELRYSFRMYY